MRSLKVLFIVIGSVIVTTLGISATDTLTGSSSSLLGLLAVSEQAPGVCPEDMIHVPTAATFTCIDRVEASPTENCPVSSPNSLKDTQDNLNDPSCASRAEVGAIPWTYVSREHAATLCARAGKRLPSAQEWYSAAIGTPDDGTQCNTHSGALWPAGTSETCQAATGIVDAVGNAWEWVQDDARDGTLLGAPLPAEGYIAQVDAAGVASVTHSEPDSLFYNDYFWSEQVGIFGILRGGYYGSREDGGVYALQAKTAPTTATVAIGFRCVR